jgi:hypothetical protein
VTDISSDRTQNKPRSRWTHIALPAAILVISIVTAVIFYSRVSPTVAYHFHNGTPDRWMSRGVFLGWMIAPQILFTFLGFSLTRILMLGSKYVSLEETPIARLLPVMGNMVVLPQIILFLAMLEFFLFNVYSIKPVPFWIIAAAILAAGAAVLAILFARIMQQFKRQQQGKNLQE